MANRYINGPTEWSDFAERLKAYMKIKGYQPQEIEELFAHFEEEEWTDNNLGGLQEDYKEGADEALCLFDLELDETDESRLNAVIDTVLTGSESSNQNNDVDIPEKEEKEEKKDSADDLTFDSSKVSELKERIKHLHRVSALRSGIYEPEGCKGKILQKKKLQEIDMQIIDYLNKMKDLSKNEYDKFVNDKENEFAALLMVNASFKEYCNWDAFE